MSPARGWLPGVLVGILLLSGVSAAEGGDADAAERQYRIARRLAAQGSPEARAALAEVIRLDPEGPLAGHALVDQAKLDSPALWPESIGGAEVAAVKRALQALDEATLRFPSGDRLAEARYLRGLLRLEPVGTYDPSAARIDLTALATAATPWSSAARYALAWVNEHQGQDGRAFDAYQRLLIDGPRDAAGIRARVGLSRILLRRGQFGMAAGLLQEAIDAGVAKDARAAALRELAVRALRREAGAVGPSRLDRVRTGIRSLVGFAPTADGGLLLGDRKRGAVVELTTEGARVGEWALPDLQAVAVDGRGRRFAAADTTVYRLERGRPARPVASLGDFAPLSVLAADATGGFWLLDRRGRRIGRIEPGRDVPVPYREDKDTRLQSLAWDGRRLVAIDVRARSVVAIERDATPRQLTDRERVRPEALAVDPAGRIALLDPRSATVRFLRADGTLEADVFASPEVTRPTAVGLGPEGELHLFDADGDWIVFR